MNDLDLDLIQKLTPDAPLPRADELAPARDRLTAAIRTAEDTERVASVPATSSSGTHARRYGLRRRWIPVPRLDRRPAVAVVATAAVAAAVVAVLIAAPGHGGQRARPGAAPVTINVAAATFLNQAATALQRQLAAPPSPGQFVYTENNEGDGRVERAWLSTDGSQPGLDLIWQGPRLVYDKTRPPCTVAQAELSAQADGAEGGSCAVGGGYGPGYFASMPTNVGDLSAYLAKIGVAPTPSQASAMGSGWQANSLGKELAFLMPYIFLLPAQQAALFQLMAQTPGFTIVRGVRDAAGRAGVGIAWTYLNGPTQVIVFNPATYAYMGVTTTGPDASDGEATALVQMAFVSKAGQLP
jgi:hypothetical protein